MTLAEVKDVDWSRVAVINITSRTTVYELEQLKGAQLVHFHHNSGLGKGYASIHCLEKTMIVDAKFLEGYTNTSNSVEIILDNSMALYGGEVSLQVIYATE